MGLREGYRLEAEKIALPGADRVGHGRTDCLPWPSAAARYRHDWLPHADWIELEGIGHCPQLDVPLETAQLILGFTTPGGGLTARPEADAEVLGREVRTEHEHERQTLGEECLDVREDREPGPRPVTLIPDLAGFAIDHAGLIGEAG